MDPSSHLGSVQSSAHSVRLNTPQRLGWVGVLSLALTMYVWRLGHEPLWLDETYSYSMVQHSLLDIVRLTTHDVHPPLYYLFLKICTLVFGMSPAALRLPSVLAALGLSVLALFPVQRLFGARTAYLFALLVATSPGFVCFAQEARMYTLAAFFVTGAAVYGRLALLEERSSDRFWFGFFTWAAAMTHYFGLAAVALNGLCVVITARVQHHPRWKSVALAVLGATLLYAPWLVPLGLQLTAVAKGFWIPPMNLSLFTFALVAPFTYKFEDVPYPWQALVAFAIVSIVLLGSVVVRNWRGRESSLHARVQLLVVYLSTLAFGLAFSSLIQPILMPRYLMVCAGVLLLASASGIDAITAQAPMTPELDALTTRASARSADRHALASKSAVSWAGALVHDANSTKLPLRLERRNLSFALFAGVLVALGLPASLRIQREVFNGPFHALAEQVIGVTKRATGATLGPVPTDEIPVFLHVDGQTLYPAWHAIPNGRHVLLLREATSFDVSQSGVYETRRLAATRDLDAVMATTNRLWLVDMDPTGLHLNPAKILEHPGWTQITPVLALNLPMSWITLRLSYFERQPLCQ